MRGEFLLRHVWLGFPVSHTVNSQNANAGRGGVPLFACAAAALHTGIVILAFFLARTLRAIDCGKAARMAISVAGIIAA